MTSSKQKYYLAIIVFFVIILVFIPLKLSQSITVKGKSFASKVFFITKSINGELTSALVNNQLGITEEINYYQSERGDNFNFVIDQDLKEKRNVKKNQKLGKIFSSKILIEIANINSAVENEKSYLEILKSGEKSALVNAAKSNLELANQKVKELTRIFNRQSSLLERNLISREEYEISEGNLNLSEIEVKVAEEKLNNVVTGVKKEEIEFVKSKISGLEKQLSILKKRESNLEILSPISGDLIKNFNSDTLLTINENQKGIFNFPIRFSEINSIYVDQQVEINIADGSKLKGKVSYIDITIKDIKGENFVVVSVSTNENLNNHFLNAPVEADFILESKTVLQLLTSYFKKEFNK